MKSLSKTLLATGVLFSTALFPRAAGAAIIHGTVTGARDSSLLAQVKVSSDSLHYTFTASDGSFTLNTEAGVSISPSSAPPKLGVKWHAGQAFFSWQASPENIAIEVRNAQGTLVEKSSSQQCCPDARFSPRDLAPGIYLFSFRTPTQSVSGKLLNLRPGSVAYLFPEDPAKSGVAAGSPLRKVAVTEAVGDTLTFSKAGYSPVRQDVGDGQSLLSVQMYPVSQIQYVIIIPMENTDASNIYGNTANAPYINDSLLPNYAHATAFMDDLPISIISEPHYVWMEAGTNVFSDHTFSDDADPSATVSTPSVAHLATQLKNAHNGADWMSYQEGINASSGTCPVSTSGFYAPKHNPFVFFQDVSGSPPSKTNAYCTAHHKEIASFFTDLAAKTLPRYSFVTPNQCHDMHGQSGCPNSNNVRSGDDWLRANLPPIIAFANANNGVIFITWDEGSSTLVLPFIAVGPGVKKGYVGTQTYNHSSMLKSAENILQVPYLSTVSAAKDFSDLFMPGTFP